MLEGIMQQMGFQFHIGTIKRIFGWLSLCTLKISFNSTLVRLKAENNSELCDMLDEFQFHIGTIKSKVCYVRVSYDVMFQFHIGTIKSHLPNHSRQKSYRFNSTLVRLKVLFGTVGKSPTVTFQFHIGTIKRLWCRLH